MLLKKLGSRVLDLIYPPVCVLCGEYSAGEHLCPRCAASLDSLRSDGSQEAEICRLNPGLELLVTPFLYTGAMRSLLLRLKTTPDHRAVDFLADELAQSLADSGIPEVTVTCMPMSKEKLRRRGYNHAELLAKAVAVRLGCGFDGKLLEHHGRAHRSAYPFPGETGRACPRIAASGPGRPEGEDRAAGGRHLHHRQQFCGGGIGAAGTGRSAGDHSGSCHYPGGLSGNASQLDPRLKSGYTGQSKQK